MVLSTGATLAIGVTVAIVVVVVIVVVSLVVGNGDGKSGSGSGSKPNPGPNPADDDPVDDDPVDDDPVDDDKMTIETFETKCHELKSWEWNKVTKKQMVDMYYMLVENKTALQTYLKTLGKPTKSQLSFQLSGKLLFPSTTQSVDPPTEDQLFDVFVNHNDWYVKWLGTPKEKTQRRNVYTPLILKNLNTYLVKINPKRTIEDVDILDVNAAFSMTRHGDLQTVFYHATDIDTTAPPTVGGYATWACDKETPVQWQFRVDRSRQT